MNNNVIITIGRQFGSGGRKIGKALAAELNIPYYDKELLTVAAQESGLDQKFLASHDESSMNRLLYAIAMGTGNHYLSTKESYSVDALAKQAQYHAIRNVAEKSSCVIVGRCADHVLQDYKNLLRVFITANDEDRIRHICQRDGIDGKSAQKKMQRIDKERSVYYFCSTDQKWGDATSYDLCINASKTGSRGAIRLIREAISLNAEDVGNEKASAGTESAETFE